MISRLTIFFQKRRKTSKILRKKSNSLAISIEDAMIEMEGNLELEFQSASKGIDTMTKSNDALIENNRKLKERLERCESEVSGNEKELTAHQQRPSMNLVIFHLLSLLTCYY